MPRRVSSMFAPSGGKSRTSFFGSMIGRGGGHRKGSGPKPVCSPDTVVDGPYPINGRSPVAIKIGRKSEPYNRPVNVKRGLVPSQGDYGRPTGPGLSRGPINVGRAPGPSRGPVNVRPGPSHSLNIGQGSSLSPSGNAGPASTGKRTSLMLQPNTSAPLIDFDSDDYSSDDEPQRGPPPPIGEFRRQSIPDVPSGSETGGVGARPMVGGFAAAAYEAAKADHYASRAATNVGHVSGPSHDPINVRPGSFCSSVNIGQGSSLSPSGHGGPVSTGKRTSLILQPNLGAPLIDFDSDDYSSDDESQRGPPPPIYGFPGQLIPSNPSGTMKTGGVGARPMVGGFAAAAYEAAKVHHYATKGNEKELDSLSQRSKKRQIVY